MNKRVKILIIAFLIIAFFATVSNAAIEIKPGTETHVSISISDAYQYCYDLRINSNTSTLGDNKLDPHLSLNKDWGAVAYLSLSGYGKVRISKIPSIQINSTSYSTTTGNKTGVMNLGTPIHNTHASAIMKELDPNRKISPEARKNIVDNKGTKYVEELESDANTNVEHSKGMALAETKGWKIGGSSSFANWNSGKLFCLRTGIVGFIADDSDACVTGNGVGVVTFRPVIWN